MTQIASKTRFTVIGAGGGGQAMAGYLSLGGFETNLYNRNMERIDALAREGGVFVEGEVEGDVEETIEGIKNILYRLRRGARKKKLGGRGSGGLKKTVETEIGTVTELDNIIIETPEMDYDVSFEDGKMGPRENNREKLKRLPGILGMLKRGVERDGTEGRKTRDLNESQERQDQKDEEELMEMIEVISEEEIEEEEVVEIEEEEEDADIEKEVDVEIMSRFGDINDIFGRLKDGLKNKHEENVQEISQQTMSGGGLGSFGTQNQGFPGSLSQEQIVWLDGGDKLSEIEREAIMQEISKS